jgi:hypothetical protein
MITRRRRKKMTYNVIMLSKVIVSDKLLTMSAGVNT